MDHITGEHVEEGKYPEIRKMRFDQAVDTIAEYLQIPISALEEKSLLPGNLGAVVIKKDNNQPFIVMNIEDKYYLIFTITPEKVITSYTNPIVIPYTAPWQKKG